MSSQLPYVDELAFRSPTEFRCRCELLTLRCAGPTLPVGPPTSSPDIISYLESSLRGGSCRCS